MCYRSKIAANIMRNLIIAQIARDCNNFFIKSIIFYDFSKMPPMLYAKR